jgi:hypothetical protein
MASPAWGSKRRYKPLQGKRAKRIFGKRRERAAGKGEINP